MFAFHYATLRAAQWPPRDEARRLRHPCARLRARPGARGAAARRHAGHRVARTAQGRDHRRAERLFPVTPPRAGFALDMAPTPIVDMEEGLLRGDCSRSSARRRRARARSSRPGSPRSCRGGRCRTITSGRISACSSAPNSAGCSPGIFRTCMPATRETCVGRSYSIAASARPRASRCVPRRAARSHRLRRLFRRRGRHEAGSARPPRTGGPRPPESRPSTSPPNRSAPTDRPQRRRKRRRRRESCG